MAAEPPQRILAPPVSRTLERPEAGAIQPSAKRSTPPRPQNLAEQSRGPTAVDILAERRRQAQTVAKLEAERSAVREAAEERRARRAARAAANDKPVAPPSTAVEGGDEDATAYDREVVSRISSAKRFPEAARERGVQGTVVVGFSIGSAGQVNSARVVQSSGDGALDTDAVETVRRAAPFGPPPRGAARSYAVPLRYRT